MSVAPSVLMRIPLVSFSVPVAPTAKGRPKFTVRGGYAKAYTPKKTRDFELLVEDFARRAMGARQPELSPVAVNLEFLLPIPASWSRHKRQTALDGALLPVSRPDIDNYAKAVLDSLNGIVFADDALVVELHSSKRYSDSPRTAVSVTRLVFSNTPA